MPAPKENASMSIFAVSTPTHDAMRRFCVTPRMNRPNRVFAISSATPPRTMKAKPMIAIRLNGRTRLLMSSTPPESH